LQSSDFQHLLDALIHRGYQVLGPWYGFSDDHVRQLCHDAMADGWTYFKLKVGGDPKDDIRRARLVRDEI
jgi:L-fuconate dehydratase